MPSKAFQYKLGNKDLCILGLDNNEQTTIAMFHQAYKKYNVILFTSKIAHVANNYFASTECKPNTVKQVLWDVTAMHEHINDMSANVLCIMCSNEIGSFCKTLADAYLTEIDLSKYNSFFDDDDMYYGVDGHPHVPPTNGYDSYIGILERLDSHPVSVVQESITQATRVNPAHDTHPVIVINNAQSAENIPADMVFPEAYATDNLQIVPYVPPATSLDEFVDSSEEHGYTLPCIIS